MLFQLICFWVGSQLISWNISLWCMMFVSTGISAASTMGLTPFILRSIYGDNYDIQGLKVLVVISAIVGLFVTFSMWWRMTSEVVFNDDYIILSLWLYFDMIYVFFIAFLCLFKFCKKNDD